VSDRDQVVYEAEMRALSEEIASAQALHAAAPAYWRRWWDSSGASELRCILMTSWDVLVVRDFRVWDEYDSYLASVGNRLRQGDDERAVSEIADLLARVQLNFMSLRETDPERDHSVATAIVGWYGWSRDRGRVSETRGECDEDRTTLEHEGPDV
jgi:hypothetical protein